MSILKFKSEQEFIIYLAIQKYNLQYRKNLTIGDCDVRSISHNENYDLAYEVYSELVGDNVRLRLYLTFNDITIISNYSTEKRSPDPITSNLDYAYVTTGTLDRQYIDTGIYTFKLVPEQDGIAYMIVTEDNIPLNTEDGQPFVLETNSR